MRRYTTGIHQVQTRPSWRPGWRCQDEKLHLQQLKMGDPNWCWDVNLGLLAIAQTTTQKIALAQAKVGKFNLRRNKWTVHPAKLVVHAWLRDETYIGLVSIQLNQITLFRVIPTMTSIRFVTGKSSGILSDISSGILSGISSGILSGISSGILPGISSAICSGISSGTLSGISSGISSDSLSGILSGKSSGICSGKHSGTLSGIPSAILSDIPSGIRSGISSGILSGISFGILSGISSGILSGIEGPRLPTELRRSQVEVQRCPLRSDPCGWGPAVPTQIGSRQLMSSSAHCARKVAKSLAKSWQGGSGHGSGGSGPGSGCRGGGGEGEVEGEEQLW